MYTRIYKYIYYIYIYIYIHMYIHIYIYRERERVIDRYTFIYVHSRININITYQRETSIPAVRAEACRESLSHTNNIRPTSQLIYIYLYKYVHLQMNSTFLLTTPVEIPPTKQIHIPARDVACHELTKPLSPYSSRGYKTDDRRISAI